MTPTPPPALVRNLKEGRCILFVGSGLSAWGNLPTWLGLLQEVVAGVRDEIPDHPDLDELDHMLQAGKLLEVADYCKDQLGGRFDEVLTRRLRGGGFESPDPHRVIVDLPFAGIVTTNFDKLLEGAYARATSGLPKTPTHKDVDTLGPLLFDGSFFILKAHGDIDRPDSLVLTARQYREIIHSNAAFSAIFSAILLTNAVLFVGYSLTDPDFRLLLDRQLATFEGRHPPRYALMSGLGDVERDLLYRTAGIRVLPYDEGKHEQVLEFLEDLRREAEGPLADTEAIVQRIPATPAASPAVRPEPLSTLELAIALRGGVFAATVREQESVLASGGGGSGELSTSWKQHVRMLSSLSTFQGSRESREDIRAVGQWLAECLPADVLAALTEAPHDCIVRLHLSPGTEGLPWEWTWVDGEHLFLRTPVVRDPVGVSDSARGFPWVSQAPRVLLIGDPGGGGGLPPLPGAREETRTLDNIYAQSNASCTVLMAEDATFGAIIGALAREEFDVVHYAGHGWFDAQESYLALDRVSTGPVLLRASDLRPVLSRRPPAIVFFNTHFSSFIPPGVYEQSQESVAPNEVAAAPAVGGGGGFSHIACIAGVGAFIGCFGTPSDEGAFRMGVEIHKRLIDRSPAAIAVHEARRIVLKSEDVDASSLIYTVTGYPEMRIP